jgi:hypothetical protein
MGYDLARARMSMSYVEPKSWTDVATRLNELAAAILSLNQSLGCIDTDIRSVALSNARIGVLNSGLICNFLSRLETGALSSASFAAILGLVTLDGSPVGQTQIQDTMYIIEKCARNGMVTSYQFQIENMLVGLAVAFGLPNPPGFSTAAAAVLKHLKLSPSTIRHDVLNLPARLRNSFHSNGVHRDVKGRSFSLCLDGFTFNLDHGKSVTCAGWGHCVLALSHSIDVVREILIDPGTKALTMPILDEYATYIDGKAT